MTAAGAGDGGLPEDVPAGEEFLDGAAPGPQEDP